MVYYIRNRTTNRRLCVAVLMLVCTNWQECVQTIRGTEKILSRRPTETRVGSCAAALCWPAMAMGGIYLRVVTRPRACRRITACRTVYLDDGEGDKGGYANPERNQPDLGEARSFVAITTF